MASLTPMRRAGPWPHLLRPRSAAARAGCARALPRGAPPPGRPFRDERQPPARRVGEHRRTVWQVLNERVATPVECRAHDHSASVRGVSLACPPAPGPGPSRTPSSAGIGQGPDRRDYRLAGRPPGPTERPPGVGGPAVQGADPRRDRPSRVHLLDPGPHGLRRAALISATRCPAAGHDAAPGNAPAATGAAGTDRFLHVSAEPDHPGRAQHPGDLRDHRSDAPSERVSSQRRDIARNARTAHTAHPRNRRSGVLLHRLQDRDALHVVRHRKDVSRTRDPHSRRSPRFCARSEHPFCGPERQMSVMAIRGHASPDLNVFHKQTAHSPWSPCHLPPCLPFLTLPAVTPLRGRHIERRTPPREKPALLPPAQGNRRWWASRRQ